MDLQKEWDRLVLKFLGRSRDLPTTPNTAFYGSLLTSLKLKWDNTIETASVGANMDLRWSEEHFKELPLEGRIVVLRHEIEHVARMHHYRMGARDPKLWNVACDFEINNDLIREGYRIDLFNGIHDTEFEGLAAEEIYNILKEDPPEGTEGFNFDLDGSDGGDPTQAAGQVDAAVANAVSKAMQVAKASGQEFGSDSPGHKYLLEQFFKPVVNWKNYVRKWMTEQLNKRESFNRRNRRFPGVYMPGRVPKDGALTSCNMYLDVSGSVTDEMIQQFVSEAKYIHTNLKPSSLRLVQFDWVIQQEDVLTPFKKFDNIEIVGRGGTELAPVREHIIETKPKLVIIITDLWCEPMEPVKGVDIVWIVWNNSQAQVNQGKVVHVGE